MMGRSFVVAHVTLKATLEQKAALSRVADCCGLSWEGVLARLEAAAQDGAAREIARLTTPGPESTQGWQQRCNACRVARAEECAGCGAAAGGEKQ